MAHYIGFIEDYEVALFTGAWIEILSEPIEQNEISTSRSLRARGLKLYTVQAFSRH